MSEIFLVLIMLVGVGVTIMMHGVACDLHVWAVDRAKMPHDRFYRYCRLVARLTRIQ